MRLIDNNQFWARSKKFSAAALALDVVEADHCVRVGREYALTRWQVAFQSRSASGCYRDRPQVKATFKLGDPLIYQVRRAKHREALNVATIEKLARYERSFDGLTYANVVGNQEPNRVQLERHEQRHELISARFDGDLPEAAEGSSTTPERKHERVTQEERRIVTRFLACKRQREYGISDWVCFKSDMYQRLILFRARDWTNSQHVSIATRQHNPLASSRSYQTSRAPS
jgi:hypothetical protein